MSPFGGCRRTLLGLMVVGCGAETVVPEDAPQDARQPDAYVAPCTSRRGAPPTLGAYDWTVEDTVELPSGNPVSVALSGEVAVVGVVTWTRETLASGAAHVLARSDGQWSVVQELRPDAASADDYYGIEVAFAGDVVAVSAPSCPGADPPRPGRVYVYEHVGDSWVSRATLLASAPVPGDCFGRDLAVSGRTLAVAATTGTWVFQRGATGWSEVAHLEAPAVAVAADAGRLLVGGVGEARVVDVDGTSLHECATLRPTEPGDTGFGASVSLAGPTSVVGAVQYSSPSQGIPRCRPGAAYVFGDDGGAWTAPARLDGGEPIGCLGDSTAAAADVVAIASNARGPSLPSIFVYAGQVETWQLEQAWGVETDRAVGTTKLRVAMSDDTVAVAWPFVVPERTYRTNVSFHRRTRR